MEEGSQRCSQVGFEDGRWGQRAKQCGWPLEARKGRAADPPEGLQKGMQPCQPFDICLERHMPDL